MKLVAQCTLPVQKVMREKNPQDHKDRPTVERKDLAPGEEFDTKDWNISDDEANSLIEAGAARKQTRPVDEADDKHASGRRPSGQQGSTSATSSNAQTA